MNKITDINITNSADQELTISFYRRGRLSSDHLIIGSLRRIAIMKAMSLLCVTSQVNLLTYGRISVWYTPKPTGKVVDAHPVDDAHYTILDEEESVMTELFYLEVVPLIRSRAAARQEAIDRAKRCLFKNEENPPEDWEECSCCDCYHPKDYTGDCRNDTYRWP